MQELNEEEIKAIIENNPTIVELSNLDMEGLKARYITKTPCSFKQSFLAAVNKQDQEEMRINYNMHAIRGKNLDFVGQQVYKIARRLEKYGYYLNYDQLITDFERILEDFEENIMDDISDLNRFSMHPKMYVILVTTEMMQTLTALKNECCYSTGNNNNV